MPDFWRGRRILVTGGHGFLGSHVVDNLKGRGATDVFAPARREYDLRDSGAVHR